MKNGRRNEKSWNLSGIYYIKIMETSHVNCMKNPTYGNSSVIKTT